jgi:CheY-like chemotaxis protein
VGDEPSKGCAPSAADLTGEVARLRSGAQEISGPLSLLIANLGFALEEIAGLTAELSLESPAHGGDNLVARVARAQCALSAVNEALKEARRGADQVRRLARNMADRAPGSVGSQTDGSVPEAAPSNASPDRLTPRTRVLVVDDEPMIVRAIQRLLEGEHEISLSTDPIAVVEDVRAGRRFDVILCDLMMPTMCGIDVFDAIRQIDADQARRMIFMTGGAFTPRVVQFLDASENARIEKPLERATLRAAILAQLAS